MSTASTDFVLGVHGTQQVNQIVGDLADDDSIHFDNIPAGRTYVQLGINTTSAAVYHDGTWTTVEDPVTRTHYGPRYDGQFISVVDQDRLDVGGISIPFVMPEGARVLFGTYSPARRSTCGTSATPPTCPQGPGRQALHAEQRVRSGCDRRS